MDVTLLFKACVKTVRATNKSLVDTNHAENTKQKPSDILRGAAKDAHLKTAKDVIKQLTNLRKFISDNRAAYLNVINYLSTDKSMNESDREEVDKTAQEVITACGKLLSEYKRNLKSNKFKQQTEEHYVYVAQSVERYLKEVSKLYAEIKAIRIKRVIETHKLSKLEGKNKRPQNGTTKQKQNDFIGSHSAEVSSIDSELSNEEIQMFQLENEHLYKELNSVSDEVNQMESKVVHIAELQQLFTEKVLQQEKDIERIAVTVATATDDVKDANEQIRSAIKTNAGLRVWVLFFLLVMSFSLLFLDWYND